MFPEILRNMENNNDSQTCECPSQCNGQTYEIRISSADIITSLDFANIDPFQ